MNRDLRYQIESIIVGVVRGVVYTAMAAALGYGLFWALTTDPDAKSRPQQPAGGYFPGDVSENYWQNLEGSEPPGADETPPEPDRALCRDGAIVIAAADACQNRGGVEAWLYD